MADNKDKGARVVHGRKKRFRRNRSGRKSAFRRVEQKFFLHLKMTDPNDPAKLVDFPEGVQVRLMANGKPLSNKASKIETDENGKVVLAPNRKTIWKRPNYHFRIDPDERTYYDVDNKKLVKSKSIKEFDERNLMEIPMVIDTKDNGFHYDKAKLALTDGMLKKYKRSKKGEGTESDPVVLEVRFYWYYLRFKYFDCIKDDIRDVPRGLSIVPVVDGKDYFSTYIKDTKHLGYVVDNVNKRIQHYLNFLGFDAGPITGVIADKTKTAIKAFQKQYGLGENGMADSATQHMLEQIFCRRNISVILDGSYAIPVWKKNNGFNTVYFETSFPKMELMTDVEAAKFDFFLYTKNKDAEPKLVTRSKIEQDNKDKDNKGIPWEKLDFLKARHYYDLPVKWSSRNYWTRYNNSINKGGFFGEVMKNKVKLYPFDRDEAKRADKTKPLLFSFDDVVLVKSDGSQVIKDKDASDNSINLKADTAGKKDGSRLSLFHIKEVTAGKKDFDLVLHDPEDAKAPYFSKVNAASANFEKNYISNVPKNARMVAFANDFYAVYKKRTAQKNEPFDPAKHARGCRAAMSNDRDCYFGEKFENDPNPYPHNYYFAKDTGNFELHYIHNGSPLEGPDNLKMRSFLLVCWSGRFKLKDYIGNTDTDADGNLKHRPDVHVMVQNDVKKFETEGMRNAKQRWEDKGYSIEPSTTVAPAKSCHIQIKPVFFFEGKKNACGGKEKCAVTISNDTKAGSMGIHTSHMYRLDYKIRNYLFSPGKGLVKDIDGKAYETLVVAHELGHAKGKDDDYAYHHKFDQYYLGMPYQFDIGSMMKDNRALRMRHFNNFLNWINDVSQKDPGLKRHLKQNQFELVHRFGGNTLRYSLPGATRDVNKPYKKKRGYNLKTGSVDFALYKIGKGETAYNLPIKGVKPKPPKDPFDGILVVFIKIGITFKNGSAGAWTGRDKWDFRWGLQNILTGLTGRFYLESEAEHAFKRIYLTLFPICVERTGADADAHYDIEVTLNDSSSISHRAGKALFVGNEVNKNWIANYILGDDDNAFVAFFKWTLGFWSLGDDEVEFARNWVRNKLGDDTIEIKDDLW